MRGFLAVPGRGPRVRRMVMVLRVVVLAVRAIFRPGGFSQGSTTVIVAVGGRGRVIVA